MSIASRLNEITEHLENDYGVLTLAGADLTNVDKNIFNLKQTWTERLLYFINNGTEVVYNNWDKIGEEGTSLTLNNTVEAPMKVLLKGNTYQDSTTGANLQKFNARTDSSGGISYSCDSKGQVITNGTTTGGATFSYNLTNTNPMSLSTGTYKLKVIGTLSSNTLILNQSSQTITLDSNKEAIITIDSDISNFGLKVRCNTGQNVNDFYITLASGTTATTERYTNGASPNPDYPQEVHTVSGDNEVEVSNGDNTQSTTYPINLPVENLFDKDNANIINCGMGGNSLNVSPNAKTLYISCNSNTTYTVSKISSKRFAIGTTQTIPQDGVSIDGRLEDNTGTSLTITTNSNAKYLCVYYFLNGTDTLTEQQILDTIQLEEGSKANTYTPYGTTPIELCSIGDYKDRFFKTSGKNLFDKDSATYKDNYYLNSNGVETYYDSVGYTTSFTPVKPNTTYTLSGTIGQGGLVRVYFFDKSKNWIDRTGAYNIPPKATFTTPNNCYYIGFQYAKSTYNASTVMINEGSEALPYEPYGTNEWYLDKKIGKVVLNGSESWVIFNSNSSRVTFRTAIQDIEGYTNANTTPNILSNRFIPATYNETWVIGNISRTTATGAGQTYVLLVYEPNTTVETFTTWLSTHNTTVYYVLSTPTYTKIEGTLASQLEEVYRAKSKEGQTNISQTNEDLPFILDASALVEE